MPEHIRALIVILFLAGLLFFAVQRPAVAIIAKSDYQRWRNLWVALTLTAFLIPNYWVFSLITALLLRLTANREQSVIAVFFFLLFLIPPASMQIPGFGMVNFLFDLNHPRLLCLAALLPLAIVLIRRPDNPRFGAFKADWLILAFVCLSILLDLRLRGGDLSFTNLLRKALMHILDIGLPYYVASRSLKNIKDFQYTFMGFLLAALTLSIIGIFEFAKHWLLYESLVKQLGLEWHYLNYLDRGGLLRASATTGQPIALGYVLVIALGLYLYLTAVAGKRLMRLTQANPLAAKIQANAYIFGGYLLLSGGIIATLSRGPWVGVIALLVSYIATGKRAFRHIGILVLAAVTAIGLLSALPFGSRITGMLPFIGSIDSGSISYRQQLLDNASIVIFRHPWFGSPYFMEEPEMQAMIQGEGIIDVVNSYIGVALEMGLIGLAFFVGFFGLVVFGMFRALRLVKEQEGYHRLGRVLLATQIAILVIIFTVSSISIIPIVYWTTAGICVAYIGMVRREIELHAQERQPEMPSKT